MDVPTRFALSGADVFDGRTRHRKHAVIIDEGRIRAIVPSRELPANIEVVNADGGLITAGFIDLQVNGGGGVLFNSQPTVDGIRDIVAAHARMGTTALLPTVITDHPEVTYGAITAVRQAIAQGIEGCLGIHIEGPFISPAKKGAHDPELIRDLSDGELLRLTHTGLRHIMITVAPEAVNSQQIAALIKAGVTVSIGHSDATYDQAMALFQAGARCVTHLFNAMSQFGSRDPGIVGAALASEQVWCGLIADGHHVHPATLNTAMQAKRGLPFFLVSDAMPTAGWSEDSFLLNDREVKRVGNRLTLEDGTLAGSDLVLVDAVRFMADTVGVALEEALRMASLYPAMALGVTADYGRLVPGRRADIVHLTEDLSVEGVWVGGKPVDTEEHEPSPNADVSSAA
ncbi:MULTISPECIES: N-acetylglucosamine-6-phosphate deacetylase [unclassified Chelatococcus]|uniref:N-acetylglucosamine-6-phosphate deacetylase n=1 Tax=unclassified Chelatococcus TaxID=2638111 RepID=UPI001BCD09CD|nr:MULTISPECIES: N-acetylglucosamine-6-phosphate deacetylase [unclassified Chelatococcus]MBS7695911.1 N-acetylglucosamine-6-phosphate deacetylase [Chelatococcus sp. YT9]MBX3555714.1 N-acetylglucosamine-6-phosphate deacetylase [Chelatococcus sp.]